jgi:dihydrofolate synthase/folylpolyglutamate synthase
MAGMPSAIRYTPPAICHPPLLGYLWLVMTSQPDTYEEALRYLCRPIRQADYPHDSLPLSALLTRLGEPQGAYRSVIVTGSRGKGTVAHLLAAALHYAGYKVGLYTGPHLHLFRERMCINGHPISREALLAQVRSIAPAVERGPGPFSTFELTTTLAFHWFASQHVDVAVLEVGIGGLWDAVNQAPADTAAITTIEAEHTSMLGTTPEQIALHKAGVIRPNGLVICAPQPDQAWAVIADTAQALDATLVDMRQTATWQSTLDPASGTATFEVSHRQSILRGSTRLLGHHNALNIAQAAAWAYEVASRNYSVGPAHVVQAANDLSLPGRAELLAHEGAWLLLDGGHTPGSAAALADLIEELPPSVPPTYVVGIASDKDAHGFLTSLRIPAGASLVLTTYVGHRATPPDKLSDHARRAGLEPQLALNLSEAIQTALEWHAGDGLIVLTGSLQLVAQAREILGVVRTRDLPEIRLTRAIFTGADYLFRIRSGQTGEAPPDTLPTQQTGSK